jgi:hypothetical protein
MQVCHDYLRAHGMQNHIPAKINAWTASGDLFPLNPLLKSNKFIKKSLNILSMAFLVWYLTKITAYFFTPTL